MKLGNRHTALGLIALLGLAVGCSSTPEGTDAGDAGIDSGVDAGIDAGVDAGIDAGEDAGVDAGLDAGEDAGVDAGEDAGVDAGIDAGIDAGEVVPSIDLLPNPVLAVSLTANGGIALLWDTSSPTFDVYFYDTATKVLTLTTNTNDFEHPPRAISGDGSRIIADYADQPPGTPDAGPVQAGIWSVSTGNWMNLGSVFDAGCDIFAGGGFGLDFDGRVASGLLYDGCDANAFRWTDATDAGVFTLMDKLGGMPDGGGADRASVVSGDGLIVAGFSETPMLDRTPALWQEDGTGILLDPVQAAPGEVLAINSDGTVVAGNLFPGAFFWTQDGGIVNIGNIPGNNLNPNGWANAISANGRLIFGTTGDPFDQGTVPFVWTADGGMQNLQDIIAAEGLSLGDGGIVFSGVAAASEDGTVLLGTGTDSFMQNYAVVVHLPLSAYGPY
jgi:uncharacterized membrane protein